VVVQFSQYYLLKKLSFLQHVFFDIFVEDHMTVAVWVCVSECSILLHGLTCKFCANTVLDFCSCCCFVLFYSVVFFGSTEV
jgi:hypothetical protein